MPSSTTDDQLVISRGELKVEIVLRPFSFTVRRAGHRLLRAGGVWVADGTVGDQFIQLTEGVIAHDELAPVERGLQACATASDDDGVQLDVGLHGAPSGSRFSCATASSLRSRSRPTATRCGWAFDWDRRSGERLVGLGLRHATALDQAGRSIQLGADRRYTGPDCPPEMLAAGGIPQGDCAPVPWLQSSRGYAVWCQTDANGTRFELEGERISASTCAAAGPLALVRLCARTPAARLRGFCRLTGFPALLPEWGYGFWKSRDIYEHQNDVLDDHAGFRAHRIALDAIVIDSPWATQYNTWRFTPTNWSCRR